MTKKWYSKTGLRLAGQDLDAMKVTVEVFKHQVQLFKQNVDLSAQNNNKIKKDNKDESI